MCRDSCTQNLIIFTLQPVPARTEAYTDLCGERAGSSGKVDIVFFQFVFWCFMALQSAICVYM